MIPNNTNRFTYTTTITSNNKNKNKLKLYIFLEKKGSLFVIYQWFCGVVFEQCYGK